MNKPILVVMAAGLGSRYGGLKQIDPITKDGNIIIDFSIFDAYKAGFRDVIFIIKEELLDTFENVIGKKTRNLMNVSYVFQSTDKFTGNKIDSSRTKPLGTGQAVLCCKELINAPFTVINADDFYGFDAFKLMFDFLLTVDPNSNQYSMIGYKIQNTITENGFVSRGVCKVSDTLELNEIVERLEIYSKNGSAEFTLDGGETFMAIPDDTSVSMNFWGFTPNFISALEENFDDFLDNTLPKNALKAEYLLPTIVDGLIQQNKVSVSVLPTDALWFGVTYKEDKDLVSKSISNLIEQSLYNGI